MRGRPHVKRFPMIEFLQSAQIGMKLTSVRRTVQPDTERLIGSLLEAKSVARRTQTKPLLKGLSCPRQLRSLGLNAEDIIEDKVFTVLPFGQNTMWRE